MMHHRRTRLLSWLVLLALLAGCTMPNVIRQPTPPVEEIPLATPLPPLAETLVSFRVEVPANSPAEATSI